MSPNAKTVFRWPAVQGPSVRRSAAIARARCSLDAALPRPTSRERLAIAQPNSSSKIGTPSAIHEKNGTPTPVARRRKPIPIRFGAVPTGVPSPPIDAPSDADSSSTAP